MDKSNASTNGPAKSERSHMATVEKDELPEWRAAWEDYFKRHPEVKASYRYAMGYWPVEYTEPPWLRHV